MPHERPGSAAPAGAPGGSGPLIGSSDEPTPAGGRSWKVWARRGVGAVLVGVAVVFVIRRAPKLGAVGSLLVHVRWPWLLVGAGAETASVLALSVLQHQLILSSGTRVSLRRVIPITLAANAVATTIPAGVLVAEGYVFRQYRRLGANPVVAAWVELAAGAIAFAALATVAFAGAVLVGTGLRSVLLPPLAVVLVGAAGAAVLFQRTALLGRMTRAGLALAERHAPEAIRSRLRRVERSAAAMADITPSAPRYALGSSAAAVNWVLDTVVLGAAILAVGGHVPWRAILLVYAGGQLLAELPITPGGLGVVEGGLVAFLTRFHVPAADAVAAVVAYRALSFWLLLVVGWTAVLKLRVART